MNGGSPGKGCHGWLEGRRTHAVFLGGAGVRYEERPPHPALAPWVAAHWRIETDVDFELRIPPDGCISRQRLLLDGRGESWARSAIEHGYYDEAHMANDVRELAGATPHALLRSPILPSDDRAASLPSS